MHGHTYRHQRPKSSPDDSAAKTNSSRGKRRDMKSKNNRASSPEDFKSIRQASSVDYMRPDLLGESSIGRHSESRTQKRNERLAFQEDDDSLVTAIMEDFNQSKSGRRSPVKIRDSSLNSSSNIYRPGEFMVKPTVGGLQQRERTPNSRVGSDVRILSGASAIGTSQIPGCQGDFCTTNLNRIEPIQQDFSDFKTPKHGSMKLNEFRKNIMDQDEHIAAANAIENAYHATALSQTKAQIGKPTMMVAYRSIIQCRQEMPLVKLAIDRHRRGESGDYVAEDNYADMASSAKLPSTYYKDVPCCENCYKIYNLIDGERNKALKKIKREAKDKETGKYWEKKHEKERLQKEKEFMKKSSAQIKEDSIENDLAQGSISTYSSSSLYETPSGTRQPLETAYQTSNVYEDGVDNILLHASRLVEGLTKLDVAEIRTMTKPPAAVEIVLEAVMILLTGHVMTFQEIRKLLGSGESFILMMRDFKISDIDDNRMLLIGPYVDNPVFKPENVVNVSQCASKFCGWVLGVVEAARYQRGEYNKRTSIISPPPSSKHAPSSSSSIVSGVSVNSTEKLTFVQKLAKRKASRLEERKEKNLSSHGDITRGGKYEDGSVNKSLARKNKNVVKPAVVRDPYAAADSISAPVLNPREEKAMAASQKRLANRLADKNGGANLSAIGDPKVYKCKDGITRLPYIALGGINPGSTTNNFIIVHDFFDTCAGTAIFFKGIVARHQGSQIFTFNYPGQADTVWPRPRPEEKKRGARDPIMNNDWLADRMNELLQYAEENGDFLLTRPFHLVGIGNGACIAAAFLKKHGQSELYRSTIKGLVSINGFLQPDPQLSSILHSAAQVFESTPHSRPDIPVSYWARFIFSEEYLQNINPNLALNILTAVSNPLTNEGRMKIARGCLQHKDLRGHLTPENLQRADAPVVPIIVLQSTENLLVNASNVDQFITGRKARHLWSHQQNNVTESMAFNSSDPQAGWVKMCHGPEDYAKYSKLGETGLKLLLECLEDERSAFVVWARAGHHIGQENKACILDLIDALCCPSEEYYGVSPATNVANTLHANTQREEHKEIGRMEVMFKLQPPAKTIVEGIDDGEAVVDSDSMFASTLNTDTEVEDVMDVDDIRNIQDEEKEGEAHENIEIPVLAPLSSIDPPTGHPSLPPFESATSFSSMSSPSSTMKGMKEQSISPTDTMWSSEEIAVAEQEGSDQRASTSRDQALSPSMKEVEVDSEAPLSFTTDDVATSQKESVDAAPTFTASSPSERVASLSPSSTLHTTTSPSSSSKKFVAADDTGSPVPRVTSPPIEVESNEETSRPPSNQKSRPNTSDRSQREDVADEVYGKIVEPESSPTVNEEKAAVITSSASLPSSPKSPPRSPPTLLSKTISHSTSEAPSSKVLDTHMSTTTGVYMADPIPWNKNNNSSLPTALQSVESTKKERKNRQWAEKVPDCTTAISLQSELDAKHSKFVEDKEKAALRDSSESTAAKLAKIKREQEDRLRQYQEEDSALLAQLEAELEKRRRDRLVAEKQRRLEVQNSLEGLVDSSLIPEMALDGTTIDLPSSPEVIREMPPVMYDPPVDLPKAITEPRDAVSSLDQMVADEEARKKIKGGENMTQEQYEIVKNKMANQQLERHEKLRHLDGEEQVALYTESTLTIQRVGRGYNGRKRATLYRERRDLQQKLSKGVVSFQAILRGIAGRKRYAEKRKLWLLAQKKGDSALNIQRCFRGHKGRKIVRARRQFCRARDLQRAYRGYLGRKAFNREKTRMQMIARKVNAANKITSLWRMKVAREEYRSLRVHAVAANEIQRVYRGHVGRKMVQRRREWTATEPGPERIKLGLKLIEESKRAFEQQEEEINALHRAQEKAEARVSHIHAELKENEKELIVLERELAEIDQIERDLAQMTHEKDLLLQGTHDASGLPKLAVQGHEDLVKGIMPSGPENDPDVERRKRAEAYALEMTIQIKRAERERKRQELEAEFAGVFAEVEKKKKALSRLETALGDMEATRERKDREFRRLQKNLMQLLLEQKEELDDLREKGIQLETATATTAAAAAATAAKAKEHDERSKVVFNQTEELMKFQFMSMSLSYFSSLNMLKSLRDMNADTTSAAIATTAEAAATSSAAAAAANLPGMQKLDLGANDFVEMSIKKKKEELRAYEDSEQKAKKALRTKLPDTVKLWTVSNVCSWLESLNLDQYTQAFKEATIDGPFLMELREEDIVQILGVKHKLHVRKILTQREKLKPLSIEETAKVRAFEHEEAADEARAREGQPDAETVFSMVRNGRSKRVEEALNTGFPCDTEDRDGNTLLLMATQQCNKRIVEMLIIRGANVNHQNAQGNTALHFALAFDTAGLIGEYLIEHGADDTIENIQGLTPYDGITA